MLYLDKQHWHVTFDNLETERQNGTALRNSESPPQFEQFRTQFEAIMVCHRIMLTVAGDVFLMSYANTI